jgi:hypothetical protein
MPAQLQEERNAARRALHHFAPGQRSCKKVMKQKWRALPEDAAQEARVNWLAKRRAARDRLADAEQAYSKCAIYVIYTIDGIYNIYGIYTIHCRPSKHQRAKFWRERAALLHLVKMMSW